MSEDTGASIAAKIPEPCPDYEPGGCVDDEGPCLACAEYGKWLEKQA